MIMSMTMREAYAQEILRRCRDEGKTFAVVLDEILAKAFPHVNTEESVKQIITKSRKEKHLDGMEPLSNVYARIWAMRVGSMKTFDQLLSLRQDYMLSNCKRAAWRRAVLNRLKANPNYEVLNNQVNYLFKRIS